MPCGTPKHLLDPQGPNVEGRQGKDPCKRGIAQPGFLSPPDIHERSSVRTKEELGGTNRVVAPQRLNSEFSRCKSSKIAKNFILKDGNFELGVEKLISVNHKYDTRNLIQAKRAYKKPTYYR